MTDKQNKAIDVYGRKAPYGIYGFLGTVRNAPTLKSAIEKYNAAPLYEKSVATRAFFTEPAEVVTLTKGK